MNDYIKREDALDIVADNNVHGEITLNRYDKIIDGIYEIPSADVAPVRHGRWSVDRAIGAFKIFVCSECGIRMESPWGFCPNCGARMDEEEEA